MDLRFFLAQRVSFIRWFYEMSSVPFVERKRQISAADEPFIPPLGDTSEPPFLAEWIDAEESLQLLGRLCLSTLTSVFHLYLKTTVGRVGVTLDASDNAAFKNGWFAGYQAYFARRHCIQFADSPCGLRLFEEIVLARNRTQHPDSITNCRAHYSISDLEKLCTPTLIQENFASTFCDWNEEEHIWFAAPPIDVTKEKLFAALLEVERFAGWVERELQKRLVIT